MGLSSMAETGGTGNVPDKVDACVVGAGPAGLAAAEVLAAGGAQVLIVDRMPSPARKFLMAGKSGLNLTKVEPVAAFREAFVPREPMGRIVSAWGPEEVARWADGLGQETFAGSTGRVFPVAMKASPLLRAWLARLDGLGVTLRRRWRWTGWEGETLAFDTPEGHRLVMAGVCVLALGGASWRRLGSDGAWTDILAAEGIELSEFRPANVGFEVTWSDHMAPFLGQPVKGTRLTAGSLESRGEWVISSRGIEGGGVYEVSAAVRDGARLTVDLLPDLDETEVARRLARPRGKRSLANHLRRTLGLDGVRRVLLQEWGRPFPEGAALATTIKALPVPLDGPRPIDEAISVAGGVAWQEVDDDLMLRAKPGTFVAGEMLDWEAPTGGYLLTGCLATGRHAGAAALKRLR